MVEKEWSIAKGRQTGFQRSHTEHSGDEIKLMKLFTNSGRASTRKREGWEGDRVASVSR